MTPTLSFDLFFHSYIKKQNQRKLLTHTKAFVESTKALMEDVMSYNDIHQIHVKNELKTSFRVMSSINLSLVDTAKTLSKPLQEAVPVSGRYILKVNTYTYV